MLPDWGFVNLYGEEVLEQLRPIDKEWKEVHEVIGTANKVTKRQITTVTKKKYDKR